MPLKIRPTNSHQRFGAKAMNRKSTPRPKIEVRITGRRPKRSDIRPRIGEQMNCITPQVVANSTFQSAAVAVSPPPNAFTRLGRTGIITPRDRTSRIAVMKMKPSAAWRLPPVICVLVMPRPSPPPLVGGCSPVSQGPPAASATIRHACAGTPHWESRDARRARREREQRIGPPPQRDVVDEGVEHRLGRGLDPQGDQDLGAHRALASTCAFNAESWSAQ